MYFLGFCMKLFKQKIILDDYAALFFIIFFLIFLSAPKVEGRHRILPPYVTQGQAPASLCGWLGSSPGPHFPCQVGVGTTEILNRRCLQRPLLPFGASKFSRPWLLNIEKSWASEVKITCVTAGDRAWVFRGSMCPCWIGFFLLTPEDWTQIPLTCVRVKRAVSAGISYPPSESPVLSIPDAPRGSDEMDTLTTYRE